METRKNHEINMANNGAGGGFPPAGQPEVHAAYLQTSGVGALLAAATGVVGASVVAMGLISLPIMRRYGYRAELAAGVICASGTLGQIIPPSIVLVVLADQLGESVGALFLGALVVAGLFTLVPGRIMHHVVFGN